MNCQQSLIALLFCACAFSGYAWNAVGHKLIAQIAYDHLTPEAKQFCSKTFNVGPAAIELYFINSAIWLDIIRKQRQHNYDTWHYLDIPFTLDKSKLPVRYPGRALWAIEQAQTVLSSPVASAASKDFFLKVLIHVIGDIHQPLHTITKISRNKPNGDLGGTLYRLSHTKEGKNLHQYWDNGGGLLLNKKTNDLYWKAKYLEHQWPCTLNEQQKSPKDWLIEAHSYAVNQAYRLRTHKKPSKKYQQATKQLVAQQIALAGCRLAYQLNNLAF